VLPCEDYESTFAKHAEVALFREFLNEAYQVERLWFPAPSEAAFLAAGRRVVDLADMMIVAWHQQPAKGTGGTADIVRYANDRGKSVHNVWSQGMTR